MVARVAQASKTVASPDPADLLAWYDRYRRDLPWRARPGQRADPYRVWLSEIMLQQTTVAAVKPYYERFLSRFPSIEILAAAPQEAVMQAWAGLGYYSRARNLHACAKVLVEHFDGRFPRDEAALRALPGIGAYTAAAIAAIAFNRPAAAVDGNVERVASRLYAMQEPLPKAKTSIRTRIEALVPLARPGDFAQALMDLGATICTPRRPACVFCPWVHACRARAAGTQDLFPLKERKAEGRLRRGAAFVAIRADGAVLLRTRPQKGLLGGMSEVPGTSWSHGFDVTAVNGEAAPLALAWRRLPGTVRHVFTHFPLELTVFAAEVPDETAAPDGCRWTMRETLADEALPNLMRKVLALALEPRIVGGTER